MHETSFTEFRNRAAYFFDLVEAGETVRVLRNGKPVADIQPVAAGLPSWKRRAAQPLLIGGGEVGKLIAEERGG